MLDDTIAAIATPIGEGGLAVIRISGPNSLKIADLCFSSAGKHGVKPSDAASHTILYGRLKNQGEVIDEVLVSVMRAPRTFTREDVVEISCHGGLLLAKRALDAVLSSGARMAEPGEFTRRAFLNGRIDLAQAEAVADLIHSRTELALRAANEQLAGKLSQRINTLRDDLMKILAHVEAHIDFPDEDIAPDTKEQLTTRLRDASTFISELLRYANEGQILRRGIRAAIIGRPNSGKSSLLNQLLGHDRAIVSPIPGTTRDTIEETANIRGLLIIFIDTAGLRQAKDQIELEGIRRSHESLQKAEIVLHVFDASSPLTGEDQKHLSEFSAKKRLVVFNKIDLPRDPAFNPAAQTTSIWKSTNPIEVCCLSGQGIEALKTALRDLVWSGEIQADMLQTMINSRHQDALQRALDATNRAREALESGQTLEFAALDLRFAVNAVGEIVGKTTTEDLLDMVFSQFCIGK